MARHGSILTVSVLLGVGLGLSCSGDDGDEDGGNGGWSGERTAPAIAAGLPRRACAGTALDPGRRELAAVFCLVPQLRHRAFGVVVFTATVQPPLVPPEAYLSEDAIIKCLTSSCCSSMPAPRSGMRPGKR